MSHPTAGTDDDRRDEGFPIDDARTVGAVDDTAPVITATAPAAPPRIAPPPTHVLYRKGLEEGYWNVRPSQLSDFVNPSDYDYEIVLDYQSSPAARIELKTNDRIEIRSEGTDIELTHLRDGVTIGRARNFNMAGNLFAVGVATVPPSTAPNGRYVLYLLEDTPMTRHRNSIRLGETGPCTQVHFEFYEDGDAVAASHFPVVDENLIRIELHEPDGTEQTDEGDGDEGRRR